MVGGGTVQGQLVEAEVRQGQTMVWRWKGWAAEGHQAQEKERGPGSTGIGTPADQNMEDKRDRDGHPSTLHPAEPEQCSLKIQ